MRPATLEALLKAACCLMPEMGPLIPRAIALAGAQGGARGYVRDAMTCVQWGTADGSGKARFHVYFHCVVSILGAHESPDSVTRATDKLLRCSLGCAKFGQCKAVMHSVPSECASVVLCGFKVLDRHGALFISPGVQWLAVGRIAGPQVFVPHSSRGQP